MSRPGQQPGQRPAKPPSNVTRAVGQQDAWDELRGDAELLTELVRAQHALILDLTDRVSALEGRPWSEPEAGHGR